ncbi:hypothetical protein BU17DRAFT_87562 [Hysterangium stoloniferum]|nr:hypothetical protein BU17DRAFT_87562 [Hysterangium stoloniferum]
MDRNGGCPPSDDIETYSLDNLISSAAGLNDGDRYKDSSINSDFGDERCRKSYKTGVETNASEDVGSVGSCSDSCDGSVFHFMSIELPSGSEDGDYIGVDTSDDNELSCLASIWGKKLHGQLRQQ